MNRYNAEGYPDPTAHDALTKIVKAEKTKHYRPLVYICSPFAGDVENNISFAQNCCRFAVDRNCIPLAPHLHYPQFMDDSDRTSRELGLKFALILLSKCDELWCFGEHISSGMSAEIEKAKRKGIPVRYFNQNREEVYVL